MKHSLVVILGVCCGSSLAAESSVCPRDVDKLNEPGIVLSGTRFECDASPMAVGRLNECGMLKWAATTMPAYTAIIKENQAFIADCRKDGGANECDQGKFSAGYLMTQLKRSIVELSVLDNNPMGPPSLSIDTACELLRRGVTVPVKPKNAVFLSDRFTFTRDVADPQWSPSKSFSAPFLLSATDDRQKNKSLIGIYDTIGYTFFDVPGDYAFSASAKIDSAAGSGPEKSNVTLGLNWEKYYFPRENAWVDSVLLRVSPEYLTDRDFKREAYQLSVNGSFSSKRFGHPGFVVCPGGCDADDKSEFYWSPSIGVELGKVVDAAGSDKLILMKQDGAYVRLAPSLTMTYKPSAFSSNVSFQFQYTQRYDLKKGWDRGLGVLSLNYAIASNAFWSLSWRKGRQNGTFEPIDTLLFGIGIRQ